MGWLGKFEARGRRFDVSSHRGDIEIFELVGTDRRSVSTDGPKSPEQIYELLSKAVA
jgi:DNA phosphorothioation-dependent restriction protein DptG